MHNEAKTPRKSPNYLTFGLDRNAPLVVRVPSVHIDQQAQNKMLLGIPESLGRRTQIRISAEVWCVWSGRWRYKRTRARHVTVSCATPGQAEALLDAVEQFLMRLDGKWLEEGYQR